MPEHFQALQLARRGRKPILGQLEEELACYVTAMHNYGFPLDVSQVRAAALAISSEFNLSHDFKAANTWHSSFLKRWDLKTRTAQPFEKHRASHMNPMLVDDYFQLLERVMNELQRDNGGVPLSSDRLFNLDETGLHRDKGKSHDLVIVPGNFKGRARKCSSEVTFHVTMVNLIFADGSSGPEFFLMPGTNRPAQKSGKLEPDGRLAGTANGTAFAMTDNGYMNDDVWTREYVPFLIKYIDQRRISRNQHNVWYLGVLDGFGSHTMTYTALMQLRQAKIALVTMPSHTSADLQPLDVAVFRYVIQEIAYEADVAESDVAESDLDAAAESVCSSLDLGSESAEELSSNVSNSEGQPPTQVSATDNVETTPNDATLQTRSARCNGSRMQTRGKDIRKVISRVMESDSDPVCASESPGPLPESSSSCPCAAFSSWSQLEKVLAQRNLVPAPPPQSLEGIPSGTNIAFKWSDGWYLGTIAAAANRAERARQNYWIRYPGWTYNYGHNLELARYFDIQAQPGSLDDDQYAVEILVACIEPAEGSFVFVCNR